MSNRRKPRPVGPGYMPKGGAHAAQAQNQEWLDSLPSPSAPGSETVLPESGAAVEGQGRARRRVVSWPSTVVLARVGAVTGTLSLITLSLHGVH